MSSPAGHRRQPGQLDRIGHQEPTARYGRARPSAVRLGICSRVMLLVASVLGLLTFCWPLVWVPDAAMDGDSQTPLVFALVLLGVMALLMAQLGGDEFDVKALALLGVLSAVGAVLRPLSAGTAGLETVFFLLLLAGRVFGPGFGFVLGTTTMFSSALLTGGVGPWLPYQMLASSFAGLGAGLLPRRARGRVEVAMLALYGAVSAFAYGWLMDLSFWPFSVGANSALSFERGAPVATNLHRFLLFNLATSMGWNAGRAVSNVALIIILGPTVLRILRRAARRAAFG